MSCMRACLVCFRSASNLPDEPAGFYTDLEADSDLCLERSVSALGT
jgi:hypothetical protein